MKPYLSHLFICIILFGTIQKNYAQVQEDSLVTEITSILDLEVKEEKYISSASKYDQTPDEAPSSITVISAEEIKAYGYETLTELLNAQAGFYYSNDRASDYIGVRGFGRSFDHNNRILLLIDGHRLNPYQIDYAPIGKITGFNLNNFERVEIVTGPGSTLYGNNAVHGVINLITRKDRDSYLPAINFKYGSYNSKYFGLRTSKQINEDFSFSLIGNYFEEDGDDLYFEEFDTPTNNNGIAKDLDAMKYSGLFATLDYKDFKISGMLKNNNKQIPTAPFNSEFNKPQSQFGNNEFVDVTWSPQISFDKFLIFNLAYDHHSYGSKLPFKFLSNEIEFNGNTNSMGGGAQFIWDFLPNNRIISGIEYRDNFSSTYKYFTGDVTFVNDEWSYKLFSLFVQNEFQYNADLSLYFGLRRDDFVGQEVAYNPRAGIVFTPLQDHTFKFLYGRSFRAPNLLERNLEERNIVGFKKNENLTSEFINTIELIWRYSITDDFKSSLSLYSYKMENLIDQIEDPIDELLQYVNIGEVNANGVEAALNYNSNNIDSYLRYSYQSARNKQSEILANSPEHLMKFGFKTKLYSILNGTIEFNYETKRKTIYNEYTDPIFLSNLNLYTDRVLDNLTFSLGVNNLFNKTIKHPVGYELAQRTITQPHRNFIFSVNVEF